MYSFKYIFTGDLARSGKMVAQQLSSCFLNAFSDGASATEGGSLFHSPITRTANSACRRASWNQGCQTSNWCPRRWFIAGASKNTSRGRLRLPRKINVIQSRFFPFCWEFGSKLIFCDKLQRFFPAFYYRSRCRLRQPVHQPHWMRNGNKVFNPSNFTQAKMHWLWWILSLVPVWWLGRHFAIQLIFLLSNFRLFWYNV